VPGPAT